MGAGRRQWDTGGSEQQALPGPSPASSFWLSLVVVLFLDPVFCLNSFRRLKGR